MTARPGSTSQETKPLPSLPPLHITSPRSPSSPINYSPSVKRKPLPPNAFSPPQSNFPLLPETLEAERTIVPPSSNTLNQILEAPPQEQPEILSPDDPQSYYFSTSPTETQGRVSFDDFPVPPTADALHPKLDEEAHLQPTQKGMGLRPGERPAPLRMDSINSVKSMDAKKPQSPGAKFTSFFMRKPQASPGADSAVTDISEGRSPLPSPNIQSDRGSAVSAANSYFNLGLGRANTAGSQSSQGSIDYHTPMPRSSADTRCDVLEAELKEISVELANSIRRELDLEDLVERLQSDHPHPIATDRTSDYFSDSGTSSLRASGNDLSTKDEIDKIKRDSEQQRAQLRVDLSHKWQEEMTQRRALESHLQVIEGELSRTRRSSNETAESSEKAKELRTQLDDARRRLQEERQVKENFEDLLTGLRAELEQHRSERDNLRDEVVPQLKARLEGLESSLSESQKTPYDVTKLQQEFQTLKDESSYDVTRLQQEIQHLKDENAALLSARDMERGTNRGSMQFIAEEDDFVTSPRASMHTPKIGGLSRSNTITGSRANRGTLARSGSLSRTNSVAVRPGQSTETPENAAERIKSVEQQRNALHDTVKYLLRRQEQQRKQFSKRTRMLEAELDRAQNTAPVPRKGGYEREVRVLRSEINTLRKRADEALDQKWQCEKNLSGLKMDLDRNKQETASLQRILQAKGSDPDVQGLMSATLENAIVEMQKERARIQESSAQIQQEEELAEQLEEYATRSEALAGQVKKQLQNNASLRARLKNAVQNGETYQHASADQIVELQAKLRRLEDSISGAQTQSETAVMKHEEELRVLKASHNAQLMRALSTSKKSPPRLLTPAAKSPLSPMFANSKRSPRLDQTSSGPGMALHEALRTEYLENKVTELEQALADTEGEIGDIVGKMNEAQVNVAELEAERDEALRLTRMLEKEVQGERTRYAELIKTLNEW
ncbi:hypothetical protein PMZ80_008513 [Knufia obscura]|uniref:DUF7603 domain-containing protein n=2 Tax=Knufia TaxID=430999 RepID=A0AAN8EC30_9EURO|nr:hypothetical protein PMZ80_008513 [Knufia obscura]KAK5951969.1 hypothetical protein OHC33_006855 [Knufia fluminis]